MVALQGAQVVYVPLEKAVAKMKRVPVDGMAVSVARALGISLGSDVKHEAIVAEAALAS